jgi:hypothetical protein
MYLRACKLRQVSGSNLDISQKHKNGNILVSKGVANTLKPAIKYKKKKEKNTLLRTLKQHFGIENIL